MQNLLKILLRYSNFLVFIILEVFAVLPVGYPKGVGKVIDRFDPARIHWEK